MLFCLEGIKRLIQRWQVISACFHTLLKICYFELSCYRSSWSTSPAHNEISNIVLQYVLYLVLYSIYPLSTYIMHAAAVIHFINKTGLIKVWSEQCSHSLIILCFLKAWIWMHVFCSSVPHSKSPVLLANLQQIFCMSQIKSFMSEISCNCEGNLYTHP